MTRRSRQDRRWRARIPWVAQREGEHRRGYFGIVEVVVVVVVVVDVVVVILPPIVPSTCLVLPLPAQPYLKCCSPKPSYNSSC